MPKVQELGGEQGTRYQWERIASASLPSPTTGCRLPGEPFCPGHKFSPPIPLHFLPVPSNFFSRSERSEPGYGPQPHYKEYHHYLLKKKKKRKNIENVLGNKKAEKSLEFGKCSQREKNMCWVLKVDSSWKRHSMKAKDERERWIWIAGNRLEVNNYS